MPSHNHLLLHKGWKVPDSNPTQLFWFLFWWKSAGSVQGMQELHRTYSEESLYDEKIASMDIHGGYDQKDATGFIKLNALRLKANAKRKK